MTRLDEIIASAIAGIPETDAAILAREVVRLREARAVVVPEYPENDFAIRESIRNAGGDPDFDQCIHRAGWFDLSSRLRAIPADRVLGERQVAVDREELEALRRFAERCAQRDHQPDEHIGSAKCVACEAEDALRANQGGAAT